MFIYEREGWPTFRWSDEALSASLAGAVRQTKKVSESPLPQRPSGRTELTPLSESGGASILVTLSADEGAFLVEVIVDGAVDRGEFLQTSHPPEPEHGPLPSSEWLVGILHPVV